MKINRFVALAVIALLVVGAMGTLTYRTYAHGSSAAAAQSQDCANQDDETIQNTGTDTDNVELQCGDQSGADTEEAIGAADTDNVEEQVGDQNAADGQETIETTDADNVEEQVGDQNAPDTGVEAPEVEASPVP